MLSLYQADAQCPWPKRPAVILIRRFSSDCSVAAGGIPQTDINLLFAVSAEIEQRNAVSLEFFLLPIARQRICISQSYDKFIATGNDMLLRRICEDDDPDILKDQTQILMIAGASNGNFEKLNRTSAFEAIKIIRKNRPKIYAQFLSWEAGKVNQADEEAQH